MGALSKLYNEDPHILSPSVKKSSYHGDLAPMISTVTKDECGHAFYVGTVKVHKLKECEA